MNIKKADIVCKAHAKYEAAAKAYIDSIKKQYPVGKIVSVKKGLSTFDAVIVSHSDTWWNSPGYLRVTNIETGKYRNISVNDIVVRIQ